MNCFCLPIQEGTPGEKQDATAGGSKPKVKVKSVDLPILANTIRQLDRGVLNDFIEYEVSPFGGPEKCRVMLSLECLSLGDLKKMASF